ncbi:MAG: HypC/HybG/HupF family hydrogenase formation chaperone [Clostridiales bacterium]|nr:HypC/HybG/HupF family hydrogenase formation chaperone [Clostridiales bacterium]
MCIAYPGRVERVEGQTATVDFSGNLVPVRVGVVDVKPGDYVLVHAGMAIEAMSAEKAQEILKLFKEMEA